MIGTKYRKPTMFLLLKGNIGVTKYDNMEMNLIQFGRKKYLDHWFRLLFTPSNNYVNISPYICFGKLQIQNSLIFRNVLHLFL